MAHNLDETLSYRISTLLDDRTAQVVHDELHQIIDLLPYTRLSSSGCPIADLTNFLVQANHVLAELAIRIAGGPYLEKYIKDYLEQLDQDTDFSLLEPVKVLGRKETILKQITQQLQDTREKIKELWMNDASPIAQLVQEEIQDHAFDIVTMPSRADDRAVHTSTPRSAHIPTASLSVNDNEVNEVNIDTFLDQLSVRGKGAYTCPYGQSCLKGGVQPSGEPVVFVRNSTFRSHLEKHQKLYKCELPNCPSSTRKFSRADLLRRHQETIQHRE